MRRSKADSDEADAKLVVTINTAESVSYGSDNNNQLQTDRAAGIDRYLGINTNPAPEGRSQVVDRSSFEMIEWIMPSLLRIFTSSDEVCKFEPVGPEDERGAQQESDYVNYVVTQRNDWHQVCHDWFKDGLMVKTGYAMAYWDKKVQVETEEYESQTDDSLAMLMKDDGVEVVKHSSYVDEKGAKEQAEQFQQQMGQYQQMAQMAQQQAQQTGQPPQLPPPPQQPPPPVLHDVVIRRTNEKGQVCLHVLPPERCKISARTPDYTLRDCPYFEVWDFRTLSELRQMGFKVEDNIADDSSTSGSSALPEQARDQFQENSWNADDAADSEPSMRRVKFRMIWIRYDYDQDGIAEMQYVCRVGNEILHRSECNRIPVASICPIPLPHRHVGLSIPDIVADLEDVKTAILRQGIDNIFLTNNQRIGVTDRVNMEDLLNNVPGGIVRIDGPPGENMVPIVTPFVFPQAIQGLEYIDTVRQNRSGVNNYFTGLDQNALNRTASGVQQLTNSAAQRVEMIARLFATGVEYLFSCVHELILKHGHKQETVRLRNQWVPIDPSEWKTREDARISVGLGTGSPDSVLGQLQMIYAAQKDSMALGIVKPQQVYRTLSEMVKAARLSAPELYFTDPQGAQQPPPPTDPHVQVKQMELQDGQQRFQAETHVDQQNKQAEMALEREKMAREDALKKYEIDVNAQVQLQIAQMKANQGANELAAQSYFDAAKQDAAMLGMKLDSVAQMAAQKPMVINPNDNMAQMMGQLSDAMQALAQAHAAPRVPIRGKDGRIEQVVTKLPTVQ